MGKMMTLSTPVHGFPAVPPNAEDPHRESKARPGPGAPTWPGPPFPHGKPESSPAPLRAAEMALYHHMPLLPEPT